MKILRIAIEIKIILQKIRGKPGKENTLSLNFFAASALRCVSINELEDLFLNNDYDFKSEERKNKILMFINDERYTPMRPSDIAFILEVPSNERYTFEELIDCLEKEGKIVITKKGKIMTPEQLNIISGTFVSHANGFGFVIQDKKADGDIFIPPFAVNGAMHKDKVWCRIVDMNGKRPEGEIIKVIEKGMNVIVGTFDKNKSFGFVTPDDKKIAQDIFIPKEYSRGAVSGHKVVVKITKTPGDGKNPEGVITEIIGHINDPGVDILSVIKQFELPLDFPDEVYREIDKIDDEVDISLTDKRKDLRDVLMVTIDGEDAKDLDDAVSIKILSNGNFELGVHIADVSEYVKENSPLDKEALKRGTSVYLVDRVIPMLPHKLSNGICSLNAGVDRLALSCIMEIDKNGKVVSHEICPSVIRVDKRMSYTIVNDLLTNEKSEYFEEHKNLIQMFKNLEGLRNILLDKRVKRGAVEFDFTEAKIILDKDGKPIDIKPYERNVATSIIEECMLICNETVAEEFYWLEIPFVFRSHSEPDSEKVQKLSEFVAKFGYKIKGASTHPKSFQKVLSAAKDTPEDIIINRVVLRSLKQARYTSENEGHFGLAAKYYCHFTSPIRRYPDLEIHRIIKEYLNGSLNEKRTVSLSKKVTEIARISSVRERVAEDAERETDNLKKVEFMADKVGLTFDGIISGVTNRGIYVELPNTVEGFIAVKNMEDDYYIYDEDNLQYIGERTHKVYALGDRVKVTLVRADLYTRSLDFEFDENYSKDFKAYSQST